MTSGEKTTQIREGEGFDTGAVERYVREHIDGLPQGELEVEQFSLEASNLTYLLRIGDADGKVAWQGVLRRPPFGPVTPKAHEMGREAELLTHLSEHYPLAPKPYFFTDDESVISTPFYLMKRRCGVVIDDELPPGVEPTEALCREISRMVADTLIELHAVDWEAAGLSEIGKPEGFLERQVRDWISCYDKAKTEEISEIESLTKWMSEDILESPPATIVHNDFKLNNMLLNPDDLTEVRAVLDWEMTTLGDPLGDLATSLSYWFEPDDPQELKVLPTVTDTPAFWTRDEFIDYYAQRSGCDLSDMTWYMVFAYFKLVVILQQNYARWEKRQTKDERFADFDERVRNLILQAHRLRREENRKFVKVNGSNYRRQHRS